MRKNNLATTLRTPAELIGNVLQGPVRPLEGDGTVH